LTKALNTTDGVALGSKNILTGKGLTIKSNKIILTKAGVSSKVTISKLDASGKITGGATKTKGVLFFYDTDDHKLMMYGLNVSNAASDSVVDKISVLTKATIATITVATGSDLTYADLLIF